MSDPICRWRNATPKTICEIVESLPKTEMTNEDFRKYMSESKWGKMFLQTPYQLACQTGLYYIDEDNIYHPRFTENISEEEADSYLFNWFRNYYVPNPYTRGFEKLDKPLFIVATLEEELINNPFADDFKELCEKILKDTVGELDIFKNVINRYSGSLKVENNKISIIPKKERKMEVNVDRNDKKAFFESFNRKIPSPATKPAEAYEQKIFYGVPGSGKSYKIDNEKTKGASEYQKQKVVFHPDYTNSDFIGQIIPKMKEIGEGENKQSRIEYSFKPGPFTTILRRALRDKEHQYYLIIEEINRGNAAAIFGDLFQLLDRSDDGWSCSPVNNDDINYYVASEYEFWDDRYSDSHEYNAENVNHPDSTEPFGRNSALRLPPNLSIYATMNTNDQNVFTLDNAFNRRFLSEYISNRADSSIKEHCNQHNLKIGESEILWGNFRNQINKRIVESGFSNAEDKQLGLFFIKKSKNSDGISSRDFSDKVLKYLWHDVFKRDRDIFSGKSENLKFEDLIDNFTGSDAFEKCFDEKFVSELKSNNSELKQGSEIDAEKSST